MSADATVPQGLRLLRLRLENLRRFSAPVEFDHLQPGLNLFVGPNGAGKSTVVAALRAAFLERHRATTLGHLQPWGRPDAVPSVEIEFDWQGRRHRLVKRFRPKPSVVLTVDGSARDGAEAEDQLASLLGFDFSERGSSKPDVQGIPGLLWVEQGRSELDDKEGLAARVGHAAPPLAAAIAQVVGEVSSSQGDALLERARAERERYLTGARGQARNALLEARNAVSTDEATIAELRSELATYRARVDELAALRSAIDQDQQAGSAARLQADLAQARTRLAEAEQLVERHRERKAGLVALQNERSLVETRRQAMADRRGERERRERELASATEAQAATRERLAAATRREATARAARDQAAAVRAQAEARQTIAQLTADHTRRLAERAEFAKRQAAIHTVRESLAQAERNVAQTRIDAKAVERLHAAVRAVQLAQARAEAVAPILRHQLLDGASITLDGRALTGQGERRLTEPVTVDIAGVGRLIIEPGAGDQTDRRDELARAEAQRDEQLAALGVTSAADADQRLARHRDAVEQHKADRQRLADLAPDGVEAIASRAAALDGEIAALVERLEAARGLMAASMPEADEDLFEGLNEATADRPTLAAASAALAEADAALRRADEQLRQAREADVAAAGKLAAARTERDRVATAAEADTPERAAAIDAEITALAARIDTAVLEVGALDQAITQARSDILRQDIARLQSALKADHDERQTRHDRRIRLESALESEGSLGLEERLADATDRHDRNARRLAQLELEASAWSRVLELLESGRQRTSQRLQAPLRARIDHYLDLLLPGATLQLTDTLAPLGLAITEGPGAGTVGALADQSYGTREQIGLIARLAYADLLAAAGRPTLVIIDDGLVHSDANRLAQMKRILFDAGQRHQILLFSCHPEAWRDIGVVGRVVGAG